MPRRSPAQVAALLLDDDGFKVCSVCGQRKVAEEFHKNATTADGLQRACKSCHKKQSRTADTLRISIVRRLDRLEATMSRVERLLERIVPEGRLELRVCKQCKTERLLSEFRPSLLNPKVRGLICNDCDKTYR